MFYRPYKPRKIATPTNVVDLTHVAPQTWVEKIQEFASGGFPITKKNILILKDFLHHIEKEDLAYREVSQDREDAKKLINLYFDQIRIMYDLDVQGNWA